MAWELELERLASELRPRSAGAFVALLPLAEALGLQATLRFSAARSVHAYVELSKTGGTVVLFRPGPAGSLKRLAASDEYLLAPRERFSLAHEIGHYLAATRLGIDPAPEGSREYWDQERAMDAFAGALLVPEGLVRNWLGGFPIEDPVHPLAVRDFSRSAKVSDEVVARAVCRVRSDIGFVKLRRIERQADKPPVLRVAFGTSSGCMRIPNIHSHVKEREFVEIIGSGDVGRRTVPASALIPAPPGHTLCVSWRRVPSPRGAETYWLSCAFSRSAQLQLRVGQR